MTLRLHFRGKTKTSEKPPAPARSTPGGMFNVVPYTRPFSSASDRNCDLISADRAELLKRGRTLLNTIARDPACCGASTKKYKENFRAVIREIATHPKEFPAENGIARDRAAIALRNDRRDLRASGGELLNALERDQNSVHGLLQYSASTEKARTELEATILKIIQRGIRPF